MSHRTTTATLGFATGVIALAALVLLAPGASATGGGPRAPRPLRPSDALPSLPGTDADFAIAINSTGLIVGLSAGWPVYWDGDGVHAVPDVLDTGEAIESGNAFDVNERGQIAVSVWITRPGGGVDCWGNEPVNRAALFENGVLRDLGNPEGALGVNARSVNDCGDAVGRAGWLECIGDPPELVFTIRAVLWRNGEGPIVLRGLGGDDTRAFQINNRGQIIGYSNDRHGVFYPVLWDADRPNRKPTRLEIDGNQLEWSLDRAEDVNDSGLIAGTSGGLPFVWFASFPDHAIQLRAPRGSEGYGLARGLNNRGECVGTIGGEFDEPKGVYWRSIFSKPTCLGTLGGAYCSPLAINDCGDIVGSSETADGVERAFVLWR